jgi:hypothetical protein
LPLIKIRGDAKADDDANVGATTARKPLNAQLNCNIAPPFLSANLNSSSPLFTDHRTFSEFQQILSPRKQIEEPKIFQS